MFSRLGCCIIQLYEQFLALNNKMILGTNHVTSFNAQVIHNKANKDS